MEYIQKQRQKNLKNLTNKIMSLEQNGKTYINGIFITEKEFGDTGDKIMKLSIPIDTFIEELKQHATNGWINIDIKRRRQSDEKGRTHYAQLNTWKPKERTENYSPNKETDKVIAKFEKEISTEDIPF